MDPLAEFRRFVAESAEMSELHIDRGQKPQVGRSSSKPHQVARSSSEVLQLRSTVKKVAAGAASCRQDPSTLQNLTSLGKTIQVSKTPLKNLKRITLKDLRLEKPAKGGYLVLRTLEPAFKHVSINTAVEDHQGNAVLFQAFNFTADLNPNVDDILPVGTVFILKEPFLTMSYCDCCIQVVCYSPCDVIILYKGHELFKLAEGIVWKNRIDPELLVDPIWRHLEPKDASEWKRRGNDLYNQGKFRYSARCYLLGLQKIAELGEEDPLMQILQSNLSAAYLQLGFFEKALDFAEKVLVVEPGSRKALLRAGRSCYQLRKYQDAKLHFEKCYGLYPDDEETKIEFQKSKDRCREQETGEFEMYKMFLVRSLHYRQKFDCADYVGPMKVIETEGKGRGVVATRDLEPGTLLVVCKAMAHSDESCMLVNKQNLVAKLTLLIAQNPHTFGPIVYDLFDGTRHAKNALAELFCDPKNEQEPIVDVQRLTDICENNCVHTVPIASVSKTHIKVNPLDESGSSLFTAPSLFKNSCLPNTSLQLFNDVIFIRAIAYIKADEELFLSDSTCSRDDPFPIRRDCFKKRGFPCCCTLCKQDGALPSSIHSKREKITSKSKKFSQLMNDETIGINPSLAKRELKKMIREMDATYRNCGPDPVKSGLFPLYITLANACAWISDLDGEIQNLHNALALFGFAPQILLSALEKGESLMPPNALLNQDIFETIPKVIIFYHKTGQNALKKKWIEIIGALEKVYSGGDIKVVKLNCDHVKEIFY